jgi:uncharacterized protein (TIGR03435 family)
VVDLTELRGTYDFQLEWRVTESRVETGRAADTPAIGELAGSAIFGAMEQIGLKLEPRKLPMPVICIDDVERVSTEN